MMVFMYAYLSEVVCLPLHGKLHSVFALARPPQNLADTMPAHTKDASER